MKKTLLALAILTAAAGTANAAEIYSSDQTSVSLKGEIDAYLANYDMDYYKDDKTKKVTISGNDVKVADAGYVKKEANSDINAWGKIQVDAETKLTDTLKLAGSFEIQSGSWYDGTNNSASFDDMYIALKADKWGFAIGETGDFADSGNAIEKTDITNEGNVIDYGMSNPTETKGHGLAYKATLTDGLTLVADVNTQATNSDNNTDNIYGLSLDYNKDIYSVGASYIAGEIEADTDYSLAAISASVDVNGIFLAATYSKYEGVQSFGFFNSDDETYYSGDAYGVAASYSVDKMRFYTTYGVSELDEVTKTSADAKGDTYNLVVGAEYNVTDNFLAFAEYQTAETSTDFTAAPNKDADLALLGAYYTF